MKLKLASSSRTLLQDESGAVMILAALLFIPIFAGAAALAIDLGNAYFVQSRLQASADQAALAAAKDIYAGTAVTTASTYGSLNAPATYAVTTNATLKCLTSMQNLGLACTGPGKANAIVVQEQTTAPLYFASLFGKKTLSLSATATASGAGGPAPLNVMIVLDTTASMNNSDPNCSVKGASRLNCALAGVQTLLAQLWNNVDQVGLMVFPGLQSASSAKYEYCSPKGTVQVAAYNDNPVYQIIGASTDFRNAGNPPPKGLNTSSNLVEAAGGSSSCSGVQAPGGVGTYYADVIKAAQAALVSTQKSGQKNVLIFLSDGDANASSSKMLSTKATNQCHQAITQAQAATAAGTLVYAIAYGASTSATGSCSTDSPNISACSTMQQIASNSTTFFSDASGTTSSSNCTSGNSVAELVSIFSSIGTTLMNARLIPNSAT